VRSANLQPGLSFVEAEGATALTVRSSDEHRLLATWRNLALVLWMRETQPSAVTAMGNLLGELAERNGRIVLLQIVEPGAIMPSTAVRDAISLLLKEHAPAMLGSAVVFEGDGFRGAAARAVVSTMALVTRLSFPHQIFASVPVALRWLDERQPAGGYYLRDQLESAVARLRLQARAARER
jgi:hypothetical protein